MICHEWNEYDVFEKLINMQASLRKDENIALTDNGSFSRL